MEKNFYEISAGGTMLREGSYLDIQRSLVYQGERADFTPFLNVPLKELEKQLKASKAEEQKIYDQLKEAAGAWDEHGAQTLLLEKAIEYLKVPEVKHTSNEWKQQEDGSWEISNLVYKMTFSIVKFGDEWKLAWELSYTAPGLSVGHWEYTRSPRQRIEYEGSKKYKTLEGAQKYIQSKFDQYADHFETISPRIPKEAKPLFSVNGQLLQGYAVMRQVKKESRRERRRSRRRTGPEPPPGDMRRARCLTPEDPPPWPVRPLPLRRCRRGTAAPSYRPAAVLKIVSWQILPYNCFGLRRRSVRRSAPMLRFYSGKPKRT